MEITDRQFKDNVFNYETRQFLGTRPTVVDLYTDWCSSCKALNPSLDRLAEKFKDRVDIIKVNISKADELTTALDIQGVPTLLFFKPGAMLPMQTMVGANATKIEEAAMALT